MELRVLSEKDMYDIYNMYMQNDFPKDELKPFDIISELIKRDKYFGYGLFEQNKLFAYAFVCKSDNNNCVLLDYLAVISDFRGKSYGSQCLAMLRQACVQYDGIFIEVEAPQYSTCEEMKSIRLRRKAFYFSNGAVETDLKCNLFGVEMDILFLKTGENNAVCNNENMNWTSSQRAALKEIYYTMFGKEKAELCIKC